MAKREHHSKGHAVRHGIRKPSAYEQRRAAVESGAVIPEGMSACTECWRIVRLHTDGTLYGHNGDWGVLCIGGSPRVNGSQTYKGPRAVCPVCGAEVSLLMSGLVRGHRITAAVGKPLCEGSGKTP
jgi:hypothetical protein